MNVECPKCKKKYKVDESLIPYGGASVRCPNCSNIFTIYKEPLDIKLEPIPEEVTVQPEKREPEPIREMEAAASTVTEPPTEVSEAPEDTAIPSTEERTKLWEKLQQTYVSEKKEKPVPPIVEEKATQVMDESLISSEEEKTEEAPLTMEEPFAPPAQEEITETPILEQEEITEVTPTLEETTEAKPEIIPTEEPVEEKPLTEEEKVEKEAKRLARSLVKDILLYHADKVEIGLRQGNLAQLIGDEIRKSWKFYKDNFPLEATGGVNYFKNALNEIIGKGKPIFK